MPSKAQNLRTVLMNQLPLPIMGEKNVISITPILCYPEPGPFITDTDLRTCTHIKNVVKRRGSLEDFQSTIGGESLLCLENGSEMNNTHRETAARHKVDWSSPF